MRAGEVESHRETRERIHEQGNRVREHLAPFVAACEDGARAIYRVPTLPTGALIWTQVQPDRAHVAYVAIPAAQWAKLRDALAVRP